MGPKHERVIGCDSRFHHLRPLMNIVQDPKVRNLHSLSSKCTRGNTIKCIIDRHFHENRCVLSSSIGELSRCEGSSTAKFAGCDDWEKSGAIPGYELLVLARGL